MKNTPRLRRLQNELDRASRQGRRPGERKKAYKARLLEAERRVSQEIINQALKGR
jgi:hypothetical protein